MTRTGILSPTASAAVTADWYVADRPEEIVTHTTAPLPASRASRNACWNAPGDGAAVAGMSGPVMTRSQNSLPESSSRSTSSSEPKRIVSGTTRTSRSSVVVVDRSQALSVTTWMLAITSSSFPAWPALWCLESATARRPGETIRPDRGRAWDRDDRVAAGDGPPAGAVPGAAAPRTDGAPRPWGDRPARPEAAAGRARSGVGAPGVGPPALPVRAGPGAGASPPRPARRRPPRR